MRRLSWLFAGLLSLFVHRSEAAEKIFNFAETKPGEIPSGFRGTLAGSGAPGEWKILLDDAPSSFEPFLGKAPATKRPVLAQTSRDRTDERYPLLIYEDETFGDFTFRTKFKLVEGDAEQMAGVAFRIRDERNYYYIRASGLSGTFYFFKVVEGVRGPPIGNKVEIPKGEWHELIVECKGNQIRSILNGKEVIPPLGDSTFAHGKIGFWTKSDAVTYFAEASIVYTPREPLAQALVRDALKKYPRLQGLSVFKSAAGSTLKVVASGDATEIGQPAPDEVQDTLTRGTIFYAKTPSSLSVVMPLRDRNGDPVAAARVKMKPFPGQTEQNAVARATPIVREMQARIRSANDLAE